MRLPPYSLLGGGWEGVVALCGSLPGTASHKSEALQSRNQGSGSNVLGGGGFGGCAPRMLRLPPTLLKPILKPPGYGIRPFPVRRSPQILRGPSTSKHCLPLESSSAFWAGRRDQDRGSLARAGVLTRSKINNVKELTIKHPCVLSLSPCALGPRCRTVEKTRGVWVFFFNLVCLFRGVQNALRSKPGVPSV